MRLIRRLLGALGLVVSVSIVGYALAELAPGEAFAEERLDPLTSPSAVERLEREAGLDRSFAARYWTWAGGVLSGTWGYSTAHRRDVSELLFPALGRTLTLVLPAFLLAWLLALPLALLVVRRLGSAAERVASSCVVFLMTLPEVTMSFVVIFIGLRTGWLPLGTFDSASTTAWQSVWQTAWHALGPVLVLVASMAPPLTMTLRPVFEDATDPLLLRSLRARGLREQRIYWRHVLRASSGTLLSALALTLSTLLGSSVIVETIFGWPGLGPLLVDSVRERDTEVVLAVVTLSCVVLALANVVSDVFRTRLDPRVEDRSTARVW